MLCALVCSNQEAFTAVDHAKCQKLGFSPGIEQRTTGTINPGVLYLADKYQSGVEAIIPINRASGDGVGVMGNLHLFLVDIFPHSVGRPLLASA
jgi:hypothetical protein